ncbi:SURF1 family protein [Comamonas faecalis]|uniref:SURF1-like protein n=2 Tax=Comamonas faecalis TaxID=1387849 RepID=A0ABP7RCY7_9BURK
MLRWWVLTLAALLLAGVTARLGAWQLSRAHEKERLQAQVQARQGEAALDSVELAAAGGAALHRPVMLRGQWVEGSTVFLDNRQMSGRVGFDVISALRLSGTEAVVAVQRGWVARDFGDRARLPELPAPAGEVRVEGRVAGEPARLFEFASTATGSGPSRIRQNLHLSDYADELGLALLPVTVQQTGPGGDGLLRQWPAADSGVDKHYGYAFQWFGLSALVMVLYVWFQIIRRFFRPGRQPAG